MEEKVSSLERRDSREATTILHYFLLDVLQPAVIS